MTFNADQITEFTSNFEKVKDKIRSFPGCDFLELYQDQNDKTIFFTYSYWQSETDLENYRNSELFKNVWGKTKPMFARKAEAWSVDKIVSLV